MLGDIAYVCEASAEGCSLSAILQGSAADPSREAPSSPEVDGEGSEYSFTNLGGGLGRGGATRGLSPDEASSFEVRDSLC